MESIKKELEEKGYIIIPNILSSKEIELFKKEFTDWYNSIPNFQKIHNTIDPHGIFKYHEVGHQRLAWLCRTHSKVLEIFKYLWNTDELVVSFDGACYFPKNISKTDNYWTHTDQSPKQKGLYCYQGFVALTFNKERTLVVYEGSHKLHEQYFKDIDDCKNSKKFLVINKDYTDKLATSKKILNVPAGALVLWDSRTFHQNHYGSPNCEERLVQYVSYLPKNNKTNSVAMQKKRQEYFNTRRTTSHWAYPIRVNSLQPQHYGNKELEIDYSKLKKPELSDLEEKIRELI
jgi:hypothetical protein